MRILAAVIALISALIVVLSIKYCYAVECAWIDRCDAYRDMVESILISEGVSTDFYYLMVAESRCTAAAKSSKGAQGFWQLMPRTARRFGCNDPHDLRCATIAAARYIRHLSGQFETFEDILKAYNMGGHNYQRLGATAEAIGLVWKVKELMKCHFTMDRDTGKR